MSKRKAVSVGKKRSVLLPGFLTLVALGIVVAGYVLAWELPWLLQLAAALGFSLFVTSIYAVFTHEAEESTAEFLQRYKQNAQQIGSRVSTADFGRQARLQREKERMVQLPLVGETSVRVVWGAIIFALVLVWWLTPLAPIHVTQRRLTNMLDPLGDHAIAMVLVLADDRTAVLQPPTVPTSVVKMAGLINESDNSYWQGIKQLAAGKFQQADELFARSIADGVQQEEAIVARGLARTYEGEFSEAVDHFDKALGASRGDVRLLCYKVAALLQGGKTADAKKVIEGPLVESAEKLSASDPLQAAVAHLRGVLRVAEGSEFTKALREFTLAYDTAKQEKNGEKHPLVPAAVNNKALLYLLQGNYGGAEGLFEQATILWGEIHQGHPLNRVGHANRAMLELIQGKPQAARKTLFAAVENEEAMLKRPHTFAEAVEDNQRATVLIACGEILRAQKWHDAASEATSGHETPLTIPVLRNQAKLLVAMSLDDQGKIAAHANRAAAERIWGENHPFTACSLLELAESRIRDADFDGATELIKHAQSISKEAFDDKHPWRADAMIGEARLYFAQNKAAATRTPDTSDRAGMAQRLLTEAQALIEKTFSKEHPTMARIAIARAEDSQNDKKTISYLRDAIGIITENHGEQHPEIARLTFEVARLENTTGEPARARQSLEKAIAILDPQGTADDPETPTPAYSVTLIRSLNAMAALLQIERNGKPANDPAKAELDARIKTLRERAAAIQKKLDALRQPAE